VNCRVLRFESESSWTEGIVSAFLEEVLKAVSRGQASFHASLAGGSTPEPIYRALAADPTLAAASADISIHLWVGDEREVPPDSDFRNGKMIAAAFGAANAWIQPPVLHLWPAGPSGASCDLFADELVGAMGRRPVFDLSLLGMGTDGHTAGLFSLGDTRNSAGLIAFPTLAPTEPRRRMTLSAETLRSSRSLLIPIKGGEKGSVLDAMRESVVYPISLVAGTRGIFYYLRQ